MAAISRKQVSIAFAAAVPAVMALHANPGAAQPVTDQFVAGASVVTRKDCALLEVRFNIRLRYTGHVPIESGDGLRISFGLVDHVTRDLVRLSRREGVRVANGEQAAISSVSLALDQALGPVMQIQFTKPVGFSLIQTGNFDNIVVLIATKGAASHCTFASFGIHPSEGAPAGAGPGKLASSVRASDKKAVNPSEQDMKAIEAWMDEGRAAIKRNRFNDAIQRFRKVLRFSENKHSAEAQELLGVALQKAGRTAEARAEYEDYLRRYRSGQDSDRVRQRLAGIVTASDAAAREQLLPDSGLVDAPGAPLKPKRSDETQWSMSGSASSFFIRDDSFNTVKDISTAPNPNADPDAHRTHQNTFLSNLDVFGTAVNDQMKTKFKLSATEEHRLDPDRDKWGVSTAFVETALKESDVMFRLGRQSRNSGGVIGRFDGGLFSWQANDSVRLNVVGGSPNWSRFDAPFKDEKYLFGASVDFGRVLGGVETSLFAIQQNDGSLIDRQAVGAEFRYFDKTKSALGTVDYDLHFQQLNAAIFSGTWTLPDDSVVTGAFDYRKVPYLSTFNALQGQPFLTLYDMLKFNSADEIKQFALDRTPTFESAMVSYSRPLNKTWQVGADATVTYLSGTAPSGGVDGTPASGTEYYLSTQLTGTSIFTPGDMFVGAFRYANLSDSNVYVLDFNTRYPLYQSFTISPRVRFGYRAGKTTDLTEYTALPSILLNYMWAPNIGLEAEVGSKWTWSEQTGIKTNTTDLFLTVGVRYDFGFEGKTRCGATFVTCPSMLYANPWNNGSMVASKGDAVPYYKAAPAITSMFVVDGGFRYWFSSGRVRYDYYADSTPTMLVSRLSYDDLTAHTGEFFFRIDGVHGPLANVFVKGYAGGGILPRGTLYDEDFSPIIDPYSKTSSDTKGSTWYATVDVGYNVFTNERFRVGAFVGYHHWQETVNAAGCTQVGSNPGICGVPIPTSVRVITEEDQWRTLRAGLVTDVRLTDRLTWTGELAFTAAWQKALDTHYFTFGADPASGHGTGFQAETMLNYQVTDNFKVGLGARWWRLNTDVIDSFGQLLKYTTDRYGVFGQASYRFK